MAVILKRYSEKQAKPALLDKLKEIKFADEASISDYARSSVMQMQKAGVITGKGNDVFAPKDSATRAEAAKMIAEYAKMAK